MSDPASSRPSILFLSSSFLTRRKRKVIRGVQLFDLLLTEQLIDLGVDLSLPVESSWDRRLRERVDFNSARVIRTPSLVKPLWNMFAARGRVLDRRYDAVIVGNPTRGIAPVLRTIGRRGMADRLTLLAHRSVRPAFARVLQGSGWGKRVTAVCVNGEIAESTRGSLPEARIATHYGIPNADHFEPSKTSRENAAPVRFGVLGKLDDPGKGADDAIEAFRSMPEGVRKTCELHLASYERAENKPKIDDAKITAHDWMDAGETPRFLRELDVLIVPSCANETFSQALVQGMLSGLPIIACNLPTLAEKLDTGGGIVVGDVPSMSRAMAELAGDATRRDRMGATGRATALDRYVWDTAVFLRDYVLAGPPGADE